MSHELLQQALDALDGIDKFTGETTDDQFTAAITALREALAAPMPEPSDMVMVPREPTPEMIEAIPFPTNVTPNLGAACYRAMIAAAPPAAPAVPLTDEQFADMVADASLAVDLAANPLKLLAFARAVLSAAPVVREPSTYRQIAEATGQWADVPSDKVIGIWRAAEQAHGIGGGAHG